MKTKIKKIAVFTSGGDSPGMNACIRAVARAAQWYKKETIGIMRGYDGMIRGEFVSLDSNMVSNIIQRGGTILKTARSKEFMTDAGMKTAFTNLEKKKLTVSLPSVVTAPSEAWSLSIKNLISLLSEFPEPLTMIFSERIIRSDLIRH